MDAVTNSVLIWTFSGTTSMDTITIVEVGGVGLVVDVISVSAKAEEQHNAAAILFYLSSNNSDASRRRSRC
uniref:Uncharacterized protein n=1 Tax=Oryza rufipogon TaxID=4529 RepID=A0A0E0P795_ORYRU